MRFNLADYETVEERLRKLHAQYDDLRVVTELVSVSDETPRTWTFKASIYLTAGDQANGLPKATGYASEIDGTGGANNGSACENAETSSIGRAAANMSFSGNKRASRQEMEKVARIEATDWLAEAENALNVETLRSLYTRAKAQGAPNEVLERLKDYAATFNTAGENNGAGRSAKRSAGKG
jgi:hypothetical protein